ncbi:MAG: hypothetical protein U5L45_13315 [Saprospiraceae bacterium]|nr:hypothetical protein [Saprospiraceae bacterium]
MIDKIGAGVEGRKIGESVVIEPSFIISEYMPLADLQTAMTLASSGEMTKIVVTVG